MLRAFTLSALLLSTLVVTGCATQKDARIPAPATQSAQAPADTKTADAKDEEEDKFCGKTGTRVSNKNCTAKSYKGTGMEKVPTMIAGERGGAL